MQYEKFCYDNTIEEIGYEISREIETKKNEVIVKEFFFREKKILLPAILLLTLLAHFPTFQNGFTESWDSENAPYIVGNPLITSLSAKNIGKMFSAQFDGHYHPITMLSLALNYHTGGLDPFQYHVTNMVLHMLNTVAVFFLIGALFQNPALAALCAVLFGVHTQHVESISWLSERKNLLYSTFYLFSLISYVKCIDLSQHNRRRSRFFLFLTGFFFILSLLSKSQAVVLPATLLVIDLVKRTPFTTRMFVEKAPFFLISATVGIIARKAQEAAWGGLQETPFSLFERSVFACYSFIEYQLKLLFPINLSAKYIYPERIDGHIPYGYLIYIIPTVLILVTTVLSLKKSKTVAFGLLFFSINIFFLLKQFKVPYGNYIMADRYTYMASIGFFVLVGTAVNSLQEKTFFKKPLFIACTLYVGALSFMTFERTKIWRDDLTFYSALMGDTPAYSEGWFNVALIKERNGLYTDAVDIYDRYADIKPDYGLTYYNRGVIKSSHLGDQEGAVQDYSVALSKDLDDSIRFAAYYQRSLAY
ncbi:MAG: tetratricopeptide repeat protein, partial [Nitrospinota bacterium]